MATILVIDDEPSILLLLSTLLKHQGHEVVLAECGREGVHLFQRERPHVVIVDLMMPDMKGLEVLREIRALDSQTPVIILTGFGTPKEEQQARELGATEFLQKCYDVPSLGAILNRLLTPEGRTESGDHRQFPRFVMQFPVILFQNGVRIGIGVGSDLSARGCTFTSQVHVEEGDQLRLQLCLPDHEEATTPLMVEISVVVRWVSKPRSGVEFVSLPSGDQQRILQYVKTFLTTSLCPSR